MFFEGSEFFEKKQKKFLRKFGNGLKWQVAKTNNETWSETNNFAK